DLGQEAHGVFGAAVDLSVALLAPIAFDLRDGHPVHADRGQSVADLIELEWLDNGHDDFHESQSPLGPVLLKAGSRRSRHPRASAFTRRGTAQPGESSRVPIRPRCYKCMTLRNYSPRPWHEAAAAAGASTKSRQARSKSRQRQ